MSILTPIEWMPNCHPAHHDAIDSLRRRASRPQRRLAAVNDDDDPYELPVSALPLLHPDHELLGYKPKPALTPTLSHKRERE